MADWTPLFHAVFKNDTKRAKFLIDAGADIHVTATKKFILGVVVNNNLLHVSAEKGYLNMTKILLEAGCDPNIEDNYGRTPLHYASSSNNLSIVKHLIMAGANVNAKHYEGNTPLYEAAKGGHVKIVETLLKFGADCNLKNKYGKAPFYTIIRTDDLLGNYYKCAKVLTCYTLLSGEKSAKPKCIEENPDLSAFWDKCERSVYTMKNSSDCPISVIKLLKETDDSKLSLYFDNEYDVRKELEKLNLEGYIPMINEQLEKGEKRWQLLQNCYQVMEQYWVRRLPRSVLYEITKYLSDIHLGKVLKSATCFKKLFPKLYFKNSFHLSKKQSEQFSEKVVGVKRKFEDI